MKKTLILLEKWVLPVLIVLDIVLITLSANEKMTAGDVSAFKATVQALTLDSTEHGFTLYMNFSIKVTLVWAAIKVYMASVGLKWDYLIARKITRDHIVIVAGSREGLKIDENSPPGKVKLAIDLSYTLSSSYVVVLVAPNLDEINRRKLWQSGVKIVEHNGNIADILLNAGTSRAETLIAMSDHFEDNVAICRTALSPALKNSSLQCKCMIGPLSGKRNFRPEEYFEPETVSRIRIFNDSELVARRIVDEFPPDVQIAQSDQRVHILLVGLGSVGQAVLQQVARMGHYRSGLKTKITIVGQDINQQWTSLVGTLPALDDWLFVEQNEMDINLITTGMIDNWLNDSDPITMIYICWENEITNLRIARLLIDRQSIYAKQNDINIADVVVLDPPGGIVLSDYYAHGNHCGHFHRFSLVSADGDEERATIADTMLNDIDDSRARSLHEAYREKDLSLARRDSGHQIHPNSVPWEELSEDIRDANRVVTDHFEVKMRAIGCRLTRIGEAEEATLSESEIEILAMMEHRRWWADRALNGWQYGQERDETRKVHPNMVPYEELSEADKQKDKDSVVEVANIMRERGMIIARTTC